MKTRTQYINGEVSHSEYYGQFITTSILHTLELSRVGARLSESKDPHFNDIPLDLWDALGPVPIPGENGKKVISPASSVCVWKEAARLLLAEKKERENSPTVSTLRHTITKFSKDGKEKTVIKVSLDDECRNGYEDFSLTADIYEQMPNGRWVEYGGGCCHDHILKLCPDLAAPFAARDAEARAARKQAKLDEIDKDLQKDLKEKEDAAKVKRFLVRHDMKENAIYYSHTNNVTVNWKNWEAQYTQDEFDQLVKIATEHAEELPEGVTFTFQASPKY